MPITDIRFEGGIYFCREYGKLTESDAQLWAEKAEEFANSLAPKPIFALIDALEVKFVSMEARRVLAQATAIEGLVLAAVVTNDILTIQSSRIINVMAVEKHTYTFPSIAEAQSFLDEQMPLFYARYEKNKEDGTL